MLLLASYYFYMCWKVEYILLILFSTIVDYSVAIKMSESLHKKVRKRWLYLSLGVNLGILFLFKYFNLFNDAVQAAFNKFNLFYDIPTFELLLPVGISFYTFQTLAYTIDVYNGKLKPERNLFNFALYVSFFPQLVAGPIERASRLLPQFQKTYQYNYIRVVGGLQQMLWGFFKKLVIADRLAPLVNEIYNAPTEVSGITLLTATYLFAFQIYCDFSGYSDIAIGSARVMGYDLMDNFKVPYLSKSIREFWQRWHISLSTWFRDYVYIPLGGNRVKVYRWYLNLLIVFMVSGLWHGANWTFLIWGALHGIYLIIEILLNKLPPILKRFPKIKHWFLIGITFHLVLLAWIFFRANTVNDAFYILKQIAYIPTELSISNIINGVLWKVNRLAVILTYIILFCFIFLDPFMDKKIKQFKGGEKFSHGLLLSALLLVLILLFGFFGEVEFIYFQF